MNSSAPWHVYILRCVDGSYYIGVASDVPSRVRGHNDGRGASYTFKRRPVHLVFAEAHGTELAARRRERQLEGCTRLAAWLQVSDPVRTVAPETAARIRQLLEAFPGAEPPVLARLHISRLEEMPADKAPHVMEWLEGKLPKAPQPAASPKPSPLGNLAAALAGAHVEATPGNGA